MHRFYVIWQEVARGGDGLGIEVAQQPFGDPLLIDI